MSNKKAFPMWAGHMKNTNTDNGMDLRDYFAAKAMQAAVNAIMTATLRAEDTPENKKEIFEAIAIIPTESYSMADAMIQERENGK